MKRLAFAALLVGLASAAAGGQPPATLTPDDAFEQLKAYDYGQSDKALHVLQLHVVRFATDPQKRAQMAERLATVLAEPKATIAAKLFVCQQLQVVGTEAQVPILVPMLDDPKTVEMARSTLEAIPGEASLAALRAALDKLQGLPLVGAINSVGVRRDAKAAATLAKLLGSADPQVAAAAAEALGRIANGEAAAALAKAEVPAKALVSLHDAQLRCAELLAAGGDAAGAEALYGRVWASERPVAWRLAGLVGLAKVAKEKAAPLVLEALGSEDPLFQATAVRLTRELPGAKPTEALVQRLEKLDAKGQALLLDVLAERGDKAAAQAVAKLTESKEPAVRVAAIQAMGKLGDAASIEPLARLAGGETGAAQQAARASLAQLSGAEIEAKLLDAAAAGTPPLRAEALRALAARRTTKATPTLLKAATEADDAVRSAAFDALAAIGQPDCYPQLIELLVLAAGKASTAAAEGAVLGVGKRLAAPAERVGPVLAALEKAPAAAKPSLLRLLAGFGGTQGLATVRAHLADADPNIKDAAVRALASWPDEAAAPDLLKLAKDADSATHKTLALRGYLRLAQLPKDEAARLKMLEQVRPIATTSDAKKLLLSSLADVAEPGALHVAAAFLDDAPVQAEAAAAMLKIGKALAQAEKKAVQAAMRKIIERIPEKAVSDQAEAVIADTLRPPPQEASARALRPDKARSEARKKDLSKSAPKGYRVVAYLDCGPDAQDGEKGGPTLRLVEGQAYAWADADAATIRYVTIFYTGDDVVFEATGLRPARAYQLGFSWWDYDHDTRVQSVWLATGKGEKSTKVVEKTKLPSHTNNQPPQEKTVPIPRELYADGTLRVTFRNEAQPNAVVSELWLLESEAEGPRGEPGPAGAAAEPGAKKARIALVTGAELHNWKATAPVLAKELAKDPRLAVKVIEDIAFLASPELKDYDVVFLHFQPTGVKPPKEDARMGLKTFVEGGKGLVLIHFACGAFPDWPEFRDLAGRAYDPKMRAHDPFGTFRVEIVKPDHPIVQGMESFDTKDELYTCLAGDRPIEILAKAVSKVDKKDYPMAFVLDYGKGRVFHCALGHDVQAIINPPVIELYRRGTAWAAGLPPVAGKE